MPKMTIEFLTMLNNNEIFVQRKDLVIYLYSCFTKIPDDKTREFIEDLIKNLQSLGESKEEEK